MTSTPLMPDDFFAAIYVEEEATEPLEWLRREGINPAAWIRFLEFVQRETSDQITRGALAPDEAFAAALAAAMHVAWEGAKRRS